MTVLRTSDQPLPGRRTPGSAARGHWRSATWTRTERSRSPSARPSTTRRRRHHAPLHRYLRQRRNPSVHRRLRAGRSRWPARARARRRANRYAATARSSGIAPAWRTLRAVADVDGNGWPEVVLVSSATCSCSKDDRHDSPRAVDGARTGAGGPPCSRLRHDLAPEIGVAKSDRYSVLEPDPSPP